MRFREPPPCAGSGFEGGPGFTVCFFLPMLALAAVAALPIALPIGGTVANFGVQLCLEKCT